MGKPSDASKPTVDPAELSVREVIGKYPVGRLIGLTSAVFMSGGSAGFFFAHSISQHQYAALEERVARYQSEAQLLDKAIQAGHCVKSSEVQRADAARAVVGRVLMAKSLAAWIRSDLSVDGPAPLVLATKLEDSRDLGHFADDPKVGELLTEIERLATTLNFRLPSFRSAAREKRLEVLKDQTFLRESFSLLNAYDAALESAERYLRAKYLPLDLK